MSKDLEQGPKEIWEEFLSVWPLSRVREMSLEEYSSVGSQDSFTVWLESRTKELGSIWGGSSFKFGVFNRKSQNEKASSKKYSYTEKYAWDNNLGASPEEAFANTKSRIIEIIESVQRGDFPDMQRKKLWPIVELKIAFLYQDPLQPLVAAVYKKEMIESYLYPDGGKPPSELKDLYSELLTHLGDESILGFSRTVWTKAERVLNLRSFTPAEALKMLSDRWIRVAEGTQKIAGFETSQGKQVALSLELSKVFIFTEPCNLELDGVELTKEYNPEAPRSSNLKAQAPHLGVGSPIHRYEILTRKAMAAFIEVYEGSSYSQPSDPKQETSHVNVPLNQILYGPPGTGKTYNTVTKALEILDPQFLQEHVNDRRALKTRFDELSDRGRVGFVTFHQSFGYEDFVEGLKANVNEQGQISYEIEDGIFKRMCDLAEGQTSASSTESISLEGRRIWKMSLGNTQGEDAYIYDDCIAEGVIRLGYGHSHNYSDAKDWAAVKEAHKSLGLEVSDTDYSIKVTNYFVNEMAKGDLVIVSDGNHKFRAIAEIVSDYYFDERRDDWYKQTRKVRWLRVYSVSLPVDQLLEKVFSQQTLYRLGQGTLKPSRLKELLGGKSEPTPVGLHVGQSFNSYYVKEVNNDVVRLTKPNGSTLSFDMRMLEELANLVRQSRITIEDVREKRVFEKVPDTTLEKYIVHGYNNVIPLLLQSMTSVSGTSVNSGQKDTDAYVLIIDEINRGNIANIFGELITLIEDSKRKGKTEVLTVTLPYSKKPFAVPGNLYIIGTMNTADRSLIHMDTALRRRFEFEPMLPKEELLEEVPSIEGINLPLMLKVINDRISVLYDREHTIGHSFFLPLNEMTSPTLADLADVFEKKVLPLLEEYFFEDWSKIRMILNDDRKPKDAQIIRSKFDEDQLTGLFGEEVSLHDVSTICERNPEALKDPRAFIGIYSNLIS